MFVKPIKDLVKKKKNDTRIGLGDDPNITSICLDTLPDQ